MSFSFNVRGKSKADAIVKVHEELGKVVAQQPVHAADQLAAREAADGYLHVLDQPTEGSEISVSVSGSIGMQDGRVTSVMVGVNAAIVAAS